MALLLILLLNALKIVCLLHRERSILKRKMRTGKSLFAQCIEILSFQELHWLIQSHTFLFLNISIVFDLIIVSHFCSLKQETMLFA